MPHLFKGQPLIFGLLLFALFIFSDIKGRLSFYEDLGFRFFTRRAPAALSTTAKPQYTDSRARSVIIDWHESEGVRLQMLVDACSDKG